MSEIETENNLNDEFIFEDDLEIDEIPDNPNHLPENTYVCRVTEADMALTKKKDKVGLTLKYQIIEGDYSTAFPFTEWLWVPKKTADREYTIDEVRALSRLKKHFIAAGFGADEMRRFKPSQFVGCEFKVRTANKQDGDYERIQVKEVTPLISGSDEGMEVFSSVANDI